MSELLKRFVDKQGLRKAFEFADKRYVTKEEGKGLSTNDFTDALKLKLEQIDITGQENVIEKVFLNGEALVVDSKKAIDINVITEDEVDAKIAEATKEIGKLKREIVEVLPPIEEADTNTIYMIPKDPAEPQNGYTEYSVIGGQWEKLGDTTVDLTNYYTKDQADKVTEKIAQEIATKTVKETLTVGEYVTRTELNTVIPTVTELDIMEMFGELEGKQAGIIKADGTAVAFDTIEEALEQAQAGETIQLVDNVEVDANATVANGVIIDLNGHTMKVKGA